MLIGKLQEEEEEEEGEEELSVQARNKIRNTLKLIKELSKNVSDHKKETGKRGRGIGNRRSDIKKNYLTTKYNEAQ